jgi:hypothetical protein
MQCGDVQLNTNSAGMEYLEFSERTTRIYQGTSRNVGHFSLKMFAIGNCSLLICDAKIVSCANHN